MNCVSNARRLLLCGVSLVAAIACGAPAMSQDGIGTLLPVLNITGTRVFGGGIVGTSTTTITAQDIERSPAQNLPEILSREPGVQVQTLFGGVNGARSQV